MSETKTSFVTDVKTCIFCGSVLLGRSDKKYCDDICRNNHHYAMRKEDLSVVKNVNGLLMHNRDVLRLVYKNKSTCISKDQLEEYDFNFELFTNVYKTKKNEEYKVVYDYAYKFINDEELIVIRYWGK